MKIKIIEEGINSLHSYGTVPISYKVKSRLGVEAIDSGLSGFVFTEEKVSPPYIKDYDLDEKPTDWARDFDLSNWGILSAFDDEKRIGGGVIAFDTENVHMLEGRKEMVVLWDLRVASDYRRKGVGSMIFGAAEKWAKERGCGLFKIETQNINVNACKFYVSQGCALGSMNRFAYPEYPHEVQLIFYKKF